MLKKTYMFLFFLTNVFASSPLTFPLADGISLNGDISVGHFFITSDIPHSSNGASINLLINQLEKSDPSDYNFCAALSAINSLACNLDTFALYFFSVLLENGTIFNVKIKNIKKQPNRAAWFKKLRKVCLSYLESTDETKKQNALILIHQIRQF